MTDKERLGTPPRARYLQVIGRVKRGSSLQQAQSEIDAAAGGMVSTGLSEEKDVTFRVVRLIDSIVIGVRGWMLLVLGAVWLLMLLACANLANLLFMRGVMRQPGFALLATHLVQAV